MHAQIIWTRCYIFKVQWLGEAGALWIFLFPSREAESGPGVYSGALSLSCKAPCSRANIALVLCPTTAGMNTLFSLDWCWLPFLVRRLLDCNGEKPLCNPLLHFQGKISSSCLGKHSVIYYFTVLQLSCSTHMNEKDMEYRYNVTFEPVGACVQSFRKHWHHSASCTHCCACVRWTEE